MRTPLYDLHRKLGARIVDFHGWEMPVQYTSIVEEHHAVRQRAGLFDISHMGRIEVVGPDRVEFLERLVSIDVARQPLGRVRYAVVCNEAGGILDDICVFAGKDRFLLVVNASNRGKILDWLRGHAGALQVTIQDRSGATGMVALQGPRSREIFEKCGWGEFCSLGYYRTREGTLWGFPSTVSRTGYTGEDGFEMIVESARLLEVTERLLETGRPLGLEPAGLGARDTLRLEAGMPLYGHELDETVNPIEAGLEWVVAWGKSNFFGKDALAAIRRNGCGRKRIGFVLGSKRIAREGYPMLAGGRQIGRVTSGTFSPTLEKPIGMGYVESSFAEPGRSFQVDIRGKPESATCVEMPFYRRSATRPL